MLKTLIREKNLDFTYNPDEKRHLDKFSNGFFKNEGFGSTEYQNAPQGRVPLRGSDGVANKGQYIMNATHVEASDLETPDKVNKGGTRLDYYNSFDARGIAVSRLNNFEWMNLAALKSDMSGYKTTAPAQGASEGLSSGLLYNLPTWNNIGKYVPKESVCVDKKKSVTKMA